MVSAALWPPRVLFKLSGPRPSRQRWRSTAPKAVLLRGTVSIWGWLLPGSSCKDGGRGAAGRMGAHLCGLREELLCFVETLGPGATCHVHPRASPLGKVNASTETMN